MNPILSPQNLAAETLASLKAAADPAVAEQGLTYFKPHEKVTLYGVRTPQLRQIGKNLYARVKGEWSVREAEAFADLLLHQEALEARALGLLVLARFQKRYEKSLLTTARSWLAASLCDNWALTDALSMEILAPLLRKYPELIQQTLTWVGSPNLWVRRAAAVSLVPLARKGEHLQSAYEVARSLFGDEEDLIHKATGWLLREAGKTDPQRLERFLLSHGPRIPRTALRYAIERFPREKRQQILSETRKRSSP